MAEQQQQQQPQQQQPEQSEQVAMVGANFLQARSQPLYQYQQYKYKETGMPGKSKVLATGENLSAPIASGASFSIEATV